MTSKVKSQFEPKRHACLACLFTTVVSRLSVAVFVIQLVIWMALMCSGTNVQACLVPSGMGPGGIDRSHTVS